MGKKTEKAVPETKAQKNTKDRKGGSKVRKIAPERRLARVMEKFQASAQNTRFEQGRLEALQHQAVRDHGVEAAMTGDQLKAHLAKTKVRPMDPKKIARLFCPNGY